MRKSLLCILTAALLLVSVATCFAQDTNYKFGILMGPGSKDQQFKVIFSKIIEYVGETEKLDFELIWYMEEDKLLSDAKEGVLDYIYTKKADPFFALMEDYGYVPFLGISLFGKKAVGICLYGIGEHKITGLESLKGLHLVTYAARDGYFPLRNLLGDDFESIFSKITLSNAGMDSLDYITSGKADLAFVHQMNVESLKSFNPTLYKKFKQLLCTTAQPSPSILHSKTAPPELTKKITEIMESAYNADFMKTYKNLMKTAKIRFFEVKPEDFPETMKLYRHARASGWEKDYQAFIKKYEDTIIESK